MPLLPTTKTAPKTSLGYLIILLYGLTKLGKSTFCSQAEGALFLATEPGLNALEVYQILIHTWENFRKVCAEISEGNHPFKTLIIDTIDNLYKLCTEHVLKKLGIEHESDLPYGKAYALINDEFQRVLTKLAFLPYGLFLISHAKEMEIDSRTGKYTRMVPTLPDKARKIVLGMADMVLFCDLEVHTGGAGEPTVRRVIRTKPSLYYEAGDRTGLLPETLDLHFPSFLDAFNAATAAKAPTKPATAKPATGKEPVR